MKTPGDFKARIGLAAALAAALLLLLNLVSTRLHLRVDASAGHLYSLGAGSKRILAALPGVVEARAYFSRELPPEYAASRAYVRDILREYQLASRGRFRFRFIDVDANEKAREEAVREGILPLEFSVRSREKAELRQGMMGISLHFEERRETLAVVSRAELIEYELTSRIRHLAHPDKVKIGVLASHEAISPESLGGEVREYLSRSYELVPVRLDALGDGAAAAAPSRALSGNALGAGTAVSAAAAPSQALSGNALGTGIPADAAALIVLGPARALEREAVYALDQFLMSGRPLVLALDGKRADIGSFYLSSRETGLAGFLRHHGVELRPNIVLDAQCQKIAVSRRTGWLTLQNVVEFPPFVLATDLDREHPVTRSVQALSLPFVSPIDLRPGSEARVLARSSRTSWLHASWGKGGGFDINPLRLPAPEDADPKGPFALAVAFEGPLDSYFQPKAKTEGDPERAIPEGAEKRFIARSPAGARMLVLGTARFAQPQAAQSSGSGLLLNLIDWAALDADLIDIRSKSDVFRPLMEIPRAAKAAIRWANILLPAFAAASFGLLRLRRRRALRALREKIYLPIQEPQNA